MKAESSMTALPSPAMSRAPSNTVTGTGCCATTTKGIRQTIPEKQTAIENRRQRPLPSADPKFTERIETSRSGYTARSQRREQFDQISRQGQVYLWTRSGRGCTRIALTEDPRHIAPSLHVAKLAIHAWSRPGHIDLPSGVRGAPGIGWFTHWARSGHSVCRIGSHDRNGVWLPAELDRPA